MAMKVRRLQGRRPFFYGQSLWTVTDSVQTHWQSFRTPAAGCAVEYTGQLRPAVQTFAGGVQSPFSEFIPVALDHALVTTAAVGAGASTVVDVACVDMM